MVESIEKKYYKFVTDKMGKRKRKNNEVNSSSKRELLHVCFTGLTN